MAQQPRTSGQQQRMELIQSTHAFFHQWLTGTAANTDAAWHEGFERSAHPEFWLVQPSGQRLCMPQLGQELRQLHGCKQPQASDKQPLRIWTEDHSEAELAPGVFLLTYVECHHTTDGQHTTRQCSAVLLASAQVPQGHVWRSVHETWLQAPSADAANREDERASNQHSDAVS